ncbi:MAG: MFS transporter [Acidisphaera sp.]|nr:MFS transporter [Acidisphaera sp.]
MTHSRWWSIGGSLMVGLFVAYLDRTNLSVGLPSVARDLGFAGDRFAVTSSWALTIFLIGYAVANIVGGVLTRRHDPKTVVIWSFAIWSAATVVAGMAASVAVLLACRLVLGIAEGIYWPQQSRFAKSWFAPDELTKANSIIQYYGQFLALAIGFMVLTPIYQAYGWRILFYLTGGIGLIVIVPLYAAKLRPESEAPYAHRTVAGEPHGLTLAQAGGPPFLLLVFSYITQGMLFWGITLWIPLAVRSLGFTGMAQALASAVPYFAAIAFAIPMSAISDRTGRRVLIASLALLIPGVMLLLLLPEVDSGLAKLALITLAMGFYAGSYTPNIWSILQSTVAPEAVGATAGIMNGLGAGGGGTLAGFLVGLLYSATGSYMSGFMVLGGLVVLGGLSLLAYGGLTSRRSAPAIRPAA